MLEAFSYPAKSSRDICGKSSLGKLTKLVLLKVLGKFTHIPFCNLQINYTMQTLKNNLIPSLTRFTNIKNVS